MTSNVTGRHRGPKRKLRAGVTCRAHVAMRFHRRVWYRALSLRYASIRSSDIILIPSATFVPSFVSFGASVIELAHREKSHSLSHSPSLFDARGSKEG